MEMKEKIRKIDPVKRTSGVFPEKQCSICGKIFTITYPSYYMYRIFDRKKGRLSWQCSYTCYRKAGGDSGKLDRHSTSKIKKRWKWGKNK